MATDAANGGSGSGGATPGSGAAGANTTPLLTEVPSSLKQLARLVVRGFYTIEDALIVDMLVRYPCMREDDVCHLLKFDKKLLRARIASLKSDKFLQVYDGHDFVLNLSNLSNFFKLQLVTSV